MADAAAPSTTSSPRRFPYLYCPRKFDTFHALGDHQHAHRRERAAARQVVTTSSPRRFPRRYCPRVFDTFHAHRGERAAARQATTSSQRRFPHHPLPRFPHSPRMYHTAEKWLEPIQPQPQRHQHQQQHLPSCSVPQSPESSEDRPSRKEGAAADDDDSGNIDLTLRL